MNTLLQRIIKRLVRIGNLTVTSADGTTQTFGDGSGEPIHIIFRTSHAERTVAAAVRSPRAELKAFTLSEGSAEHCGIDVASMQGEYLFDWLAATLGARSPELARRLS